MRIQLSGVSKVIEKQTVLDKIDLTFASGDVSVLIGPVGSGKTTLIHLILQVYKTTKGNVFYDDFVASLDRRSWIQNKIAFIPAQPYFDPHLTLIENLEFLDRIYFPKSKMKERRRRSLETLERCELISKKHCKGCEIELPKRKQLAMVQGLRVEADVIIIDEPFNGENTYQVTSEYIELCKARGSSLLIVTSECSNILSSCNRYIYIKEGTIVAEGDYNRLLSEYKVFAKQQRIVDFCELSRMILE